MRMRKLWGGVIAALALCCAVSVAAPVTARAASVRLTPKGSFENNRFHLTYTIPSDWKVEDDAVIDPLADLFDLMLATAKSQGYKIDYYPSMPGDSNECTVTVVNGNADVYFYYVAGSFSLTTDANSTVTNEDDGASFWDLTSLDFGDSVTRASLMNGNSIKSSLAVSGYMGSKSEGASRANSYFSSKFGNGAGKDAAKLAPNSSLGFETGFAIDGPRVTNNNADKQFGWSTPITLSPARRVLNVTKTWVTDDGGTPAESVSVAITKGGQAYKTVTLKPAGWSYTETVFDNDAAYQVDEQTVDGFTTTYKTTESTDDKGQRVTTFAITNDDVKKPAPTPKPTSKPTPKSAAKATPKAAGKAIPKTGDAGNGAAAALVLGAGTLAAGFALALKKRTN
ncbi:MAG: Cna B-type domain-containing protein [Parafannyhessea sp.]|uniref:Cna B-type domain-containing protein n=1 Tax=Parafannyhessea sp. TaxID=2847324 RepID=UPI003F10CF13